jgi:hypothetical protein
LEALFPTHSAHYNLPFHYEYCIEKPHTTTTMLMNYHELTMDEPANSKSRKLQFRVICIVMATCIVWSLISSGALRPVEVTEGVFPGGEFFYKITGRDYAASQSLINDCSKHLEVRELDQGNVLYTLYLDDPVAVNGRRQRFAGGYLLNDQTVTRKQESNEERKRILMQINEQVKEASQVELEESSAFELWPKLKYSSVELPRVKAAVVEYTYSNGFVSALLHSYKVSEESIILCACRVVRNIGRKITTCPLLFLIYCQSANAHGMFFSSFPSKY